jgi:hypothetical protein
MTSVASGGQVLEESETETVLKDGTVKRERPRRFAPPDWPPDAWLLERRSKRYARPKVQKEARGNGKAPPFAGDDREGLAAARHSGARGTYPMERATFRRRPR